MHCNATDHNQTQTFFPQKHNYDETVAIRNQVKNVDSLLKYRNNRNNRRLFLFNIEMRLQMRFFVGLDAIFLGKKGAMRFRLRCDAIAIPALNHYRYF